MNTLSSQEYLDSCNAIKKSQAPFACSLLDVFDLNARATIVVVTYKRAEALQPVIEQLACQDYPSMEIIIVDGSPNAEDIYRKLNCHVGKNLSYIISRSHNICVLRNLGLLASSGDVVIFVDDDVFLDKDFVSRHMALHFSKVGRVAKLVSGHSIPSPLERIGWVRSVVTYCPTGRWARNVYGVNFSVKRQAVIECGGFNPYIPMVGDETELFTRMVSHAWEAINGEEVAVVHRALREGGCRIKKKDPSQMARTMSGRLLSRLSVAPLYYLFLLFPGQIIRAVMSGEFNHFASLEGTRIFFYEFVWYIICSLRLLKRRDRYFQKSLELAKPRVLSGSAVPILSTNLQLKRTMT